METEMSQAMDMNTLKEASNSYYSIVRLLTKDSGSEKATGRFFTPKTIYDDLIAELIEYLEKSRNSKELRIIDPFAGDGRLVIALIEKLKDQALLPQNLYITLRDIDTSSLINFSKIIEHCLQNSPCELHITIEEKDSFVYPVDTEFDICITNPPWCILKPTSKLGTKKFDVETASMLNNALSRYCQCLRELFPEACKDNGFKCNEINLSRCGIALSLRLIKDNGYCAIVMPATLFSDQVSFELRKMIFEKNELHYLAYYPAECKLFGKVDQTCISAIISPISLSSEFKLRCFSSDMISKDSIVSLDEIGNIKNTGYIIPFYYSREQMGLLQQLSSIPTLGEYKGIHFAREIDETRIEEKLSTSGKIKFVKGYMISRYSQKIDGEKYLSDNITSLPESIDFEKIVWRDVSRESQKKRIQATIVPMKYIAGNSLGVLFLDNHNSDELRYVLAILNSYIFEFLARPFLITNHVPAGIIKKVPFPPFVNNDNQQLIIQKVSHLQLNDNIAIQWEIECLVAKEYGLKYEDFRAIMQSFTLTTSESKQIEECAIMSLKLCQYPPNHYAAKLSDLDKLIISYVPQGGNWKNIPDSVPSQRLVQIRKSFSEGRGSRSTYYGRLREDMPAYTISTYFGRPGNGCNIHYEQDRTLSQREAARLQGFPDSFVFKGSIGAISEQIGNAVPPILAYQIATALPIKGLFVDLFCGAGGLALGFKWANWKPVIANDINSYAIETHIANIQEDAICGDITSDEVINMITQKYQVIRDANPDLPLFVIGGPPCQGFSTANCARSTNDQRNWLFKAYIKILSILKPIGFIFENVTGILNFEKGQFFEIIKKDLKGQVEEIKVMKLNCAEYGIPQRRERVIILGASKEIVHSFSLSPITSIPIISKQRKPESLPLFPDFEQNTTPMHRAISVKEALSDLPPITDAQDGSHKEYISSPQNAYQKLMRGAIDIKEYLDEIKNSNCN
ncbi:MAG: DNA (cytosine-5-)-methyltransferase [Thermotogaceae bacterium]|nr:DNA (cytosine-5-)-methyltransferase [Thermotogaceae bacterium]